MKRVGFALQVVLLAALIGACLFGFALIQMERGCPLTEPNCVYVIQP